MPSAIQFVKPDTTAETKLRNYIREQITLRSQPAKLRKLFLKFGRDHRGRFNFVAFRKAILQIGCRPDVIDANKQTTLKAVFKTCAHKGRMSWSDFAGKLLVLPEEGNDLSDTFTGRLKGGAGSIRELKRMEIRDHHQSEIRSGGIQFFVEIYKSQILQRGLTHPSLELVYKRNDSNKDGKLTLNEFIKSINEVGIHNCARSDIKEFAMWMMKGGKRKLHKSDQKVVQKSLDQIPDASLSLPIKLLVDLVFRDPLLDHSVGALFFSGGGSRTHERDCSVQPRGVHYAINIVRQRIAQIPGMDKQGGVSHFFDLVDPDADGEVDKLELSLALKKLLKITNKDLHPKDIRGLFEHLDADNSHSIDKDEFVQVFGLPSDRKGAAECIENRRKGGRRKATQATQGLSAQEKEAREYKMKKQEAAKNQLLKHVRERVSLLCRRRGLKDLWISKMCQGLRKGKLNRSSFKAGLRHLGCRGFGPGDSDLLFDFCVDHHALDNNQESVIGFTAFSRVFSPDTFHYTTINPNESGGAGIDKSELAGSAGGHILPSDPDDLPPQRPILDLNAAPEEHVQDAYVIGLPKMERMVKEKCWSKALSNGMGHCATTNPNNLKKLMRRFCANGTTFTKKEFIQGLRDPNGLDIKNCTDKDLIQLFNKYMSQQSSGEKTTLSLNSFVQQVVPKGINAAGTASITHLFTGNRKTYDHQHPSSAHIKHYSPAHQSAPFGLDSNQEHMQSNHGATIGYLGSQLNDPSSAEIFHQHVIHDKPFEDNGIFFENNNKKNKHDDEPSKYASETTKDMIGQGAKEGCKHYYDIKHGGGFYEGIKEPKYGELLHSHKVCKPTASGILNFTTTPKGYGGTNKNIPMVSESRGCFNLNIKQRTNKIDNGVKQPTAAKGTTAVDEAVAVVADAAATAAATTSTGTPAATEKEPHECSISAALARSQKDIQNQWNQYLISPRRHFDHKLAPPYATTVVPRRPTTPLRPTPLSTPAPTSLATSLAATPETTTREAARATETTASTLMKPTAPPPTNNRKTSYRPTSAAAIRRILSQRKATVATRCDEMREGPTLLAKYVPILPKSKVDFGFQTALKAARSVRNPQNRTSRAPSRSQSGRRSYKKSSTKRSFVPVVAMVRPQLTNFRGLHFQS